MKVILTLLLFKKIAGMMLRAKKHPAEIRRVLADGYLSPK